MAADEPPEMTQIAPPPACSVATDTVASQEQVPSMADDAAEEGGDVAKDDDVSSLAAWKDVRFAVFAHACTSFVASGCGYSIASITVLLLDLGYGEVDLFYFQAAAMVPLPFRFVIAIFLDRSRPPWKGFAGFLAGRRRSKVLVLIIGSALTLAIFGLVSGEEPTPVSAAAAGFVISLQGTTITAAMDGHASELLHHCPPEYLADVGSARRFSGRFGSVRGLSRGMGSMFCTLFMTQLGPAWSWTGAFVVLAVAMLLLSVPLLFLKDIVHVAPGGTELIDCAVVSDWFWRRGEHRDLYVFIQKMSILSGLSGFGLFGFVRLIVPYMKRELDIATQTSGALFLLFALGQMIGTAMATCALDRVGTRPVLLYSAIAIFPIPLVFFFFAAASGLRVAFAICFVFGVIAGPLGTSLYTILYANPFPSAPATTFGIAMTSGTIGVFFSNFLLAIASVSYAIAFSLCCGALALQAGLCYLMLLRDPRAQVPGKYSEVTTAHPPTPKPADAE